MTIAYSTYFTELDSALREARRLLVAIAPPGAEQLSSQLEGAAERLQTEAPLRVTLVGEFNAGKTSLIGALTGAEVEIDADVCTTEVTAYSWRGLTLMDTPGVQAEGVDTDHDRIAREATVGADLVLFVMTNELLNPRLLSHLRFILDESGLGLAKKTAVVVNKIDRETNPVATLLGEIQNALGPHRNTPIFFCAASKLLHAKNAPRELQERFIRQSGIAALTTEIDQFVDDAGTLGRLATPLQIVATVTGSLQASLVSSGEDKNHLELIRRQKVVLHGLEQRFQEIRKTWKQRAYSTILGLTESAVEQIDELSTEEDLESLFHSGLKQAVGHVESLYDGLETDLDEAVRDSQRKLEEIGASPLAREVDRAAADRADTTKVNFSGAKPGSGDLAAKFGKAATGPLKDGLKAAAKDAKGLRDIVYRTGKALGKKFRPFEAVKLGKKLADVAGKAGKAMPFLAAALDLYLQFREEKAKEAKARYLASMRLALRNAFADQAKLEAEALEAGIVKVSQGPVAAALALLDSNAEAMAVAGSTRQQLSSDAAVLVTRCTQLRTRMMSGVQRDASAE